MYQCINGWNWNSYNVSSTTIDVNIPILVLEKEFQKCVIQQKYLEKCTTGYLLYKLHFELKLGGNMYQ